MADHRGQIRTVGKAWLPGVFLLLVITVGCGEDPYSQAPIIDRQVHFNEQESTRQPARLQVLGDSLFVSLNGLPRLEIYDLNLNPLGSVDLMAPEPILPTSFSVTDSQIVITDHGKGLMARFDRKGRYLDSFGTLPDGKTRLAPIAVTCFRGVAYVADMKSKRVLAISLNEIPDITESGEMLLSIPVEGQPPVGFPSAVHVTQDGRLLLGDAEEGLIRVFTCDGRSIYQFDRVPDLGKMAPQGFAFDDMIDPSLQDEHSFDPSGVRSQGRVHLVDGYNGKIHMFNPLGRYIGSYPEGTRLSGPSGIAVDRNGRRIYVADPPSGRILQYRY